MFWAWMLATLARCQAACPAPLAEGAPSGDEIINACAQAASHAIQSAWADVPVLPADTLASRCVAMSEDLLGLTFGESACLCPEACAIILTMQGLTAELESTARCTQTLLLLVRAYGFLGESEPAWASPADGGLGELVYARREQCAKVRRVEIERLRLPRSQPFAKRGGLKGCSQASRSVAVLVAATPNQIHTYQPFLNLWRCYAVRHGISFILETDDTEVSPPHHRAPNWLRWFSAKKFLNYYEALLVVDPDQFVVPECWNVSIPAVLGAWAGGIFGAPDVATRDFGKPQTLNNGVVFIRSSPRGHFFLDLLLEKASWMQNIEKDQGAFDETVLEVLGLEAAARGEAGYDSECAQYIWPNAKGNHEIALYALCWWRTSERLAGQFGARRSSFLRFADPRLVDVNHVVGARGLSEPAVLHHFAGRSKDWDFMLETFGMARRNTGNCQRVFEHVDSRAAVQRCIPGGPPVMECEPPMLVC
ncbi:unnamed protein product [Effrenium voratum]|uniref:Uncharacterized protein n=1 Tax=Effrenium voratum TaxID=2562239 RepID=A0AA36J1S5_9DINO|nr:unnamed protein product [Effrenium voratum]